jgi:hypothetical protein
MIIANLDDAKKIVSQSVNNNRVAVYRNRKFSHYLGDIDLLVILNQLYGRYEISPLKQMQPSVNVPS